MVLGSITVLVGSDVGHYQVGESGNGDSARIGLVQDVVHVDVATDGFGHRHRELVALGGVVGSLQFHIHHCAPIAAQLSVVG